MYNIIKQIYIFEKNNKIMEEIKNTIIQLVININNETQDWYNWRAINESKIPLGIKINGPNQYYKNIDLKIKLHEKWCNPTTKPIEKQEIINYYISDWGGIHRNNPDNIKKYNTLSPEELISSRTKGIASWSKALCIRDPNNFAIYDARVAVALNFLQIINNIKGVYHFPILPSRNNNIIKGNQILKQKIGGLNNENHNNFYTSYNKLLRNVVDEIGDENIKFYTVEMILFSKAEELVNKYIEIKNNKISY